MTANLPAGSTGINSKFEIEKTSAVIGLMLISIESLVVFVSVVTVKEMLWSPMLKPEYERFSSVGFQPMSLFESH